MTLASSDISIAIDCVTPVEAAVSVGGLPGVSALDIWLLQPGNAGNTMAEYLESLRGPQGERGLQGEPGPQGDGSTGIGGYDVLLDNVMPGDVLRFGDASWRNDPPTDLTDGGNF